MVSCMFFGHVQLKIYTDSVPTTKPSAVKEYVADTFVSNNRHIKYDMIFVLHQAARCLIESATPVRLEIVQKTSPKGCCTYGESMFAPVGRGTPGHPDRGRQRHERQEDGPFAGAQPVQHQQGDQAQHVVPVQRERVLTAIPAETAEDGPVDGPVSHRRPRGGARPAAGAPDHAGATACHANACGRGWPNGRVAAGRTSPAASRRSRLRFPAGVGRTFRDGRQRVRRRVRIAVHVHVGHGVTPPI